MNSIFIRTAATGLFLAAFSLPAQADKVLIAVATNFAAAATEIAAAFRSETGHDPQIATGATGKLYAQIIEGAPFEILLAADTKTPEKLATDGQALPETRFTYAVGGLTLWSAQPDLISNDPQLSLTSDKIRFLAIANPDLAPYGAAAREVLIALKLWDQLQPKIVMGQNIGQVFALADTGAADAAFIATSALHDPAAPTSGSSWNVPQDLYTPILQDAVLLTQGKDNPAALAFMAFLKGDQAHAIIADFGYSLPE